MWRWIIGVVVVAVVVTSVSAVIRSHSNSFVGKWRPVKMTVNGQPVDPRTQPNVTEIEIRKNNDGDFPYILLGPIGMEGSLRERNGYLRTGRFADGYQSSSEDVFEYSIDENTHRLIMNERYTSSKVGLGTSTSTTRIEYVRIRWLFN